jgi:hypothetical protein
MKRVLNDPGKEELKLNPPYGFIFPNRELKIRSSSFRDRMFRSLGVLCVSGVHRDSSPRISWVRAALLIRHFSVVRP